MRADPWVPNSIPVGYHTFVEIDHEIISTVIVLPSTDSFKKGFRQLQAKVCARSAGKRLVQNVWCDCPDMIIAVDWAVSNTPNKKSKHIIIYKTFQTTYSHRVGGNRKRAYIEERRSKLIINKRVFDCHLSPKSSKTLLLSTFDPRSLIVDSVFDCRLPGVIFGTFDFIPRVNRVSPNFGVKSNYSVSVLNPR